MAGGLGTAAGVNARERRELFLSELRAEEKRKHPMSQTERLGLRQTREFTVTMGPGAAEPGQEKLL